jgi:hypothetical protein
MKADPPTLFGVYSYHLNAAIRAYDKFFDGRASSHTRQYARMDNDLHVSCCEAIEPYLTPDQIKPVPRCPS